MGLIALDAPDIVMPRTINLAATPRGAPMGGLGLIAMVVLVAVVWPQAWWYLVFAVLGGVVLGICMIAVSRRRIVGSPSGGSPRILFSHDSPAKSRLAQRTC